jgi:flagellar motility protein MotE (MotC chaperone)
VIVTRQRRKPFPWRRLILPLIAVGLVAFVFWWEPSRNVVTNGPLAPMWRAAGPTFDTIATPFHFEAQNLLLTDRNKQIVTLQKQVADLQSQVGAKDKTISDLNGQIGQLQTQAASSRGSSTAASAAPAASSAPVAAVANSSTSAGNGLVLNDLSSGATPDMRRTAQYWANMEPDNVAKVLPKLPIPYVARVLALMSPGDVGAILDALPATYAAQLTQEHPELKQ